MILHRCSKLYSGLTLLHEWISLTTLHEVKLFKKLFGLNLNLKKDKKKNLAGRVDPSKPSSPHEFGSTDWAFWRRLHITHLTCIVRYIGE